MPDDDRPFNLIGLADYSGMSVRTLRRYLVDADRPLPHHYIRAAGKNRGHCIIYKREFDAWARGFPPARQPERDNATPLQADAAAIVESMRRG